MLFGNPSVKNLIYVHETSIIMIYLIPDLHLIQLFFVLEISIIDKVSSSYSVV